MAIVKCPECGKEISDSAVSCPNCGKPLQHLSKVSSEPIPPKKKSGTFKKILIGIAVVFVGMIVLGMIVGDDQKTSSSNTSQAAAPKENVITVGVEEICKEYAKNEVAADKKYKGNLIKITGRVDDVKKDIMDSLYVTLKRQGDFELCQPQCFFDDEHEDQLANLSKGQTVTIIGRVDGLMMNVLIKDAQLAN